MIKEDSLCSVDNKEDEAALRDWKDTLLSEPYRSYLYSYPHKMSYRKLNESLPLADLWREEAAETFFLYMHIPFCGARCGFCNLFTLPDKRASVHEQYVDALERQAGQWAPFAGGKPVARFAIGGGTPTLLLPDQLDRLFAIAEGKMGVDLERTSISVEASPETVTAERLHVLKSRSVDRISMGIQSFVESEASAIYRPQKPQVVEQALSLLKQHKFPILNLDLIYGLPGQTVETWLYSLERALSYSPEEIFIYPLYTRDHTIVKPGQIKESGSDIRMDMYVAARDRLTEHGYVQSSMRRFARPEGRSNKQLLPYSCQEEGMIGLGCGARSYTQGVHYATRYGVSRSATESIIEDYVSASDYTKADYGFILDGDESRRRFILKAILHIEGLEMRAYKERFGTNPLEDYPELEKLALTGLAVAEEGIFRLTPEGLAHSDAIGDWLISPHVRSLMESFIVP
ncbi:STM4012 family radical SAM protein [Paenibacillus sp. GCM10027627]|uniref:STM4012 family radical SAM protein n=1 Tax=unclassified Paenibacillus TaxID=185978 RepID=UPI003637E344